jgi:hypothetical protein
VTNSNSMRGVFIAFIFVYKGNERLRSLVILGGNLVGVKLYYIWLCCIISGFISSEMCG